VCWLSDPKGSQKPIKLPNEWTSKDFIKMNVGNFTVHMLAHHYYIEVNERSYKELRFVSENESK